MFWKDRKCHRGDKCAFDHSGPGGPPSAGGGTKGKKPKGSGKGGGKATPGAVGTVVLGAAFVPAAANVVASHAPFCAAGTFGDRVAEVTGPAAAAVATWL